MATYASITFDFNQAKAEATKLEHIAAQMKKMADRNMQNALNQLANGWKGESATLYIRKCETVRSNIIAEANDLIKIASSIRSVAQRIYNAEMEAKRLAEEIARKKG